MKEALAQMIAENPRTVGELATAIGATKQQVLEQLQALPVQAKKEILRTGSSRPIVVVRYHAS